MICTHFCGKGLPEGANTTSCYGFDHVKVEDSLSPVSLLNTFYRVDPNTFIDGAGRVVDGYRAVQPEEDAISFIPKGKSRKAVRRKWDPTPRTGPYFAGNPQYMTERTSGYVQTADPVIGVAGETSANGTTEVNIGFTPHRSVWQRMTDWFR